MSDTEDSRPLSAPPVPTAEEMVSYDEEASHYEASAPVPVYRYIMRVSDRHNWQHYYTMPANVGMNNLAGVINAMEHEGVPLQNVQVTFEVEEMKR